MNDDKPVMGFIGEGKEREKTEGDCEIAVMGKEGDVKTIWNPHNTEEVENARASYDRLKAKGYLAFRVDAKGEKGEQMTDFDPTAGKILMVPPFQGG